MLSSARLNKHAKLNVDEFIDSVADHSNLVTIAQKVHVNVCIMTMVLRFLPPEK